MRDPRRTLRFDPSEGTVIRHPPGAGHGHWVGGAKVWYDPESGTFALFYRERRPLEKGRGGRCAVALSLDGIALDTVWETDKESLDASSIEVGHAVRHDESEWRLYVSYERRFQRVWRIDIIRAKHPAGFDPQARRTVLEPGHFGVGWIKDPWVVRTGGSYEVFCAVPARQEPTREDDLVEAAPDDSTVVAESVDGIYFPTLRWVFEPTGQDTWDGRRARLVSLFPFDGRWVGTYSGGRTVYDTYEEWCGLVESPDRRRFTRLDTGGPWIRSPHGCVRYVYGLPVGERVFFYYEYTRADGADDLRVAVVRP